MDWDQLATISQLMTGAAMLAVSVFLATQLRIQRQDSERAHNDSERDFAFLTRIDSQNVGYIQQQTHR